MASTNYLSTRELLSVGISGGLAAAASIALHQPLIQLKTHMQRERFSLRGFLMLSGKFPAKTLYGGVLQRMLMIMPEKGFKMQGYEWTRNLFEGRREQSLQYQGVKWLISGGVAGVCTSVLNSPSELITIQATVWRQTLRDIIKQRGVTFLYTGWSACLCRELVFGCIFFPMRHLIQLRGHEDRGRGASGMDRYRAGLISGMVAALVTTPFDVLKTRMQSIDIRRDRRVSMGYMFSHIVREEGTRALWRGLIPRLVSIPSHLSFFYLCFEMFAKK